MANEKIRLYAAGKGVKLWQLADKMGLQDSSLSRKLRHEFNDEETEKAIQAINDISCKK